MISPARIFRRATAVPRVVGQLARHGRPPRLLLFGPLSLGDDLLCTAVLREARLRGQPFAMMTNRPELFAHNSDPSHLIPVDDYYAATLARLGTRVVSPYYLEHASENPDRDLFPAGHIITEMCRVAGLSGEISLRPYLNLTSAERSAGAIHPRQIALHSTGAAAAIPYANKEWGPQRFAAVARLLAPDFHLIQVGSARDPALPVHTDLRGKTTLRATAAILANSLTFIGLEGFLAHLARAVDCRAVVIFGGRSLPKTFGYIAHRDLIGPVSCSPCGLRDTCDRHRECMTVITPAVVASAAREVALSPRVILHVETAVLP
jgi:hypothetical protein